MIDPKGLRDFRPDRRRLNDPDETEGRAIYRERADAEARQQLAMTRKVRLRTDPPRVAPARDLCHPPKTESPDPFGDRG